MQASPVEETASRANKALVVFMVALLGRTDDEHTNCPKVCSSSPLPDIYDDAQRTRAGMGVTVSVPETC